MIDKKGKLIKVGDKVRIFSKSKGEILDIRKNWQGEELAYVKCPHRGYTTYNAVFFDEIRLIEKLAIERRHKRFF